MKTTKLIARIVGISDTNGYSIVKIDTDIPGIIIENGIGRKGYVRQFISSQKVCHTAIGEQIEITSTFYSAGEMHNGHTIEHDCYFRSFDFVK